MRRTVDTIPSSATGLAVLATLALLLPLVAAARVAEAGEAQRETPDFRQEPQRVRLPSQDKTYVESTPDARQLEADKVFQQGNRSFEKRQLDDAIRHYRKAYALWPHPIILFNMAINLGFLSNPLGAAEMFRKVLEYRPGPITQERYDEAALNYQKLMMRLSTLRVVCRDAGAEVFVDGASFGLAPVDRTVTLTPGRHLISARLKEKVPYSGEVVLKAGYHGEVTVALQAFVDIVKTRVIRRYHWWVPALASVVTAVAVSAGAALWATGRGSIQDLRQAQLEDLTDSQSYPISYDTAAERRAERLQIAGQVMVGVAVTAAVAAVTLWVLRRKRESFTVEMTSVPGGGVIGIVF